MFSIFQTILYHFIVAEYFHIFYIFQKSYFKESWCYAISYLTVSSSLGLLFPVVWAF